LQILKKKACVYGYWQVCASDNPKLKLSRYNAKSSEQLGAAPPKPESEIITTLRGEVENIQDGIRSLMMARSYLLRRIEEEKRNA
jgi:hypothetical protein